MTAAYGAIGTGANGSTSVAPSYPTGITVGQLLLLHLTGGATNSEVPDTPAGWILLATGASTDGTFGVDTGPRRATVFARVADGTESGTLTVNITNGNTYRGSITRWTSSIGKGWLLQAIGAADSTSDTSFSAGGTMSWATGDCAAVTVGQRVDTVTQSAQALTAAGTTFGTRTNRASVAVTTGNDHRHLIDTLAAVTTGGGSATTTWSFTGSAATSGGAVIVRIREIGDVAESFSLTDAQTLVYLPAPERSNERLVASSIQGALIGRRAALAEAVNQTYNRSVAESIALTASQIESSTLPRTVAESISTADSSVEYSTLPRSQGEALTLSAVQSHSLNSNINKSQSEALTLTAAQIESTAFPKTVSEALTLSHGQFLAVSKSINESLIGSPIHRTARWIAAIGPGLSQRSEFLTISATQTETGSIGKSVAETLSISASQVNRGFNSSRSESLTLSAAQTEIATVNSIRAEALTLSESSIRVLGAIKTQSEALTLSESAAGFKSFSASVAETLSIVGSQIVESFTLSPPKFNPILVGERRESIFQPWAMDAIFSAQRLEALTLTDAQSESIVVLKQTSESIALSHAQTETGVFTKAVSDSLSIASATTASTGVLYVKQIAEQIVLTESRTEVSTLNLSRSELLILTPDQTESTVIPRNVSELFSLADSTVSSLTPIYSKQVAENLVLQTLQDASVNHSVFVVQRQESIGLSPTQFQTPSLNFSQTELLLLNVATEAVADFSRFVSESIGLSDSRYIVIGPFSESYRYDVPATSLRYDIPATSLRYDFPGSSIEIEV